MATLRRSTKSFRRQGSSGSVWDDPSIPAADGQNHRKLSSIRELRQCQSGAGMIVNGMNHEQPNAAKQPQHQLRSRLGFYCRSLSSAAAITNQKFPWLKKNKPSS